jgi:hypothetical protein
MGFRESHVVVASSLASLSLVGKTVQTAFEYTLKVLSSHRHFKAKHT